MPGPAGNRRNWKAVNDAERSCGRRGRYPSRMSVNETAESEVVVEEITDPAIIRQTHKPGNQVLYKMYDGANPGAGCLWFDAKEWEAFVLGVRDGEFDLDEDGNLPPLPGAAGAAPGSR